MDGDFRAKSNDIAEDFDSNHDSSGSVSGERDIYSRVDEDGDEDKVNE